MSRRLLKGTLVLLLLAALAACAGRAPTPQTAHGKVQKYFHKYGKRYKESDFGTHAVEKVEIAQVQELQKKMAEVGAYVYLSDGIVYKVRVILRKKTFGWRVISWETLGKA